jgi:hypothetical protein
MNAALWLAVGTAAGVLVGVTLADRGGSGKLLGRITGALNIFDRIARLRDAGNGQRAAGNEPDDDDEEEEFETAEEFGEAGIEYEDTVEDEGTGFEPDSGGDYIDERVLAAFEQDPILAERDIEIDEPEPAVIALTGRVATREDARHAVTIARGVPGVERVENYIRIRNRPPVSPPPEESDV